MWQLSYRCYSSMIYKQNQVISPSKIVCIQNIYSVFYETKGTAFWGNRMTYKKLFWHAFDNKTNIMLETLCNCNLTKLKVTTVILRYCHEWYDWSKQNS